MLRDMGLVIKILQFVRRLETARGDPIPLTGVSLDRNSGEILYHVNLCRDAGLVRTKPNDGGTMNDWGFAVTGLTWHGHNFLDNIEKEKRAIA